MSSERQLIEFKERKKAQENESRIVQLTLKSRSIGHDEMQTPRIQFV